MKKSQIRKSYLYFHNGINYDNLIILRFIDKNKYTISRNI